MRLHAPNSGDGSLVFSLLLHPKQQTPTPSQVLVSFLPLLCPLTSAGCRREPFQPPTGVNLFFPTPATRFLLFSCFLLCFLRRVFGRHEGQDSQGRHGHGSAQSQRGCKLGEGGWPTYPLANASMTCFCSSSGVGAGAMWWWSQAEQLVYISNLLVGTPAICSALRAVCCGTERRFEQRVERCVNNAAFCAKKKKKGFVSVGLTEVSAERKTREKIRKYLSLFPAWRL